VCGLREREGESGERRKSEEKECSKWRQRQWKNSADTRVRPYGGCVERHSPNSGPLHVWFMPVSSAACSVSRREEGRAYAGGELRPRVS
jgi:hypothetical protein